MYLLGGAVFVEVLGDLPQGLKLKPRGLEPLIFSMTAQIKAIVIPSHRKAMAGPMPYHIA